MYLLSILSRREIISLSLFSCALLSSVSLSLWNLMSSLSSSTSFHSLPHLSQDTCNPTAAFRRAAVKHSALECVLWSAHSELGQLTSWRCDAIALQMRSSESAHSTLGVCDTENVGIDPISSKYRASIADTDTCHLKKHTFKWPTTI